LTGTIAVFDFETCFFFRFFLETKKEREFFCWALLLSLDL